MIQGGGDWRLSALGRALLSAQADGVGQVWAGPTNVMETVQAEDIQLRKALAKMILELIENRRMWWGFEYELLDDFFRFLRQIIPDSVRYRQFFDHYGDIARQTWLGALALTAATGGESNGPVMEELRRTKTMNQLIHARFALDPQDWVHRMIDAMQNLKTTQTDPLEELEKMSTEEMRLEIKKISSDAQRLSNSASQKLNRNRAAIATAYGALEIGSILDNIFRLPLDRELTFNIPLLVAHWESVVVLRREPLPNYIREATEEALTADPRIAAEVIQRVTRVAAKCNLPVLAIGFQVILREMQRCMNNKELPTGGLAFDGDHASAVNRFHIFMTFDEGLAGSLKAVVNAPRELTGIQWKAKVVTSVKQLMDALR